MAYNFNPYFPMYQQPYQQPIQPQQIQNGGFVSARSIEEAFNWPVAPGNSLTFKIENQPYVCTKTKGYSPLDQPVFESYKLVKVEETPQETPQTAAKAVDYDAEIKSLWDEVNALKGQIKASRKGVKNDKSANDHAVQTVHGKSAADDSTDENPA